MTVTPATPLKNVADMLVRLRVDAVPVLTPQGRVAGVVAKGDLLRKEQLQRDPDGRHSMHLPYRTRRDIATAETAGTGARRRRGSRGRRRADPHARDVARRDPAGGGKE